MLTNKLHTQTSTQSACRPIIKYIFLLFNTEIQKLMAISQGACSSTSTYALATLPETSDQSSSNGKAAGEEDCEDELLLNLPTRMSDRESASLRGTYDCQSDNSYKMTECPIYEVINEELSI